MRVLLVEATPGVADGIRERVENAGHVTVTCPGGSDCSLVGLGRCPLVDDGIDVVVDVRDTPGPFTPHEQPLVCGILAGVPTVVCGPLPEPAGHIQERGSMDGEPDGAAGEDSGEDDAEDAGPMHGPRDIWQRADVRCQPDGVVEAIAEATLPTSPTISHRITTAVAAVLRRRGHTAPFSVVVTTRRGAVDVHLEFAGRVPPPAVREQLRIVVRAVLIPVTHSWSSADVLIFDTRGVPVAADEQAVV
jgi:hypothetical protein